MIQVNFKAESDIFVLPEQKTDGAAGFDLKYCGSKEITVPNVAGLIIPVDLGFSMEIPSGYEAQIRPRSGLAKNYGITIANSPGTIDADYRGVVKALLLKTGIGIWDEEAGQVKLYEELVIKPGDRVCQMVICKLVEGLKLDSRAVLSSTDRGVGGFGSTGVS